MDVVIPETGEISNDPVSSSHSARHRTNSFAIAKGMLNGETMYRRKRCSWRCVFGIIACIFVFSAYVVRTVHNAHGPRRVTVSLPVHGMAFSPDGLRLAIVTGLVTTRQERGELVIVNVLTSKKEFTLETPAELQDVAWITNDKLLMCERLGWSVAECSQRKLLKRHEIKNGVATDIGLSPKGNVAALANRGSGEVIVFEVDTGRVLATLREPLVSGAIFVANGALISVGDQKISLWNNETYTVVKSVPFTDRASGRKITASRSHIFTWIPWGAGQLREVLELDTVQLRGFPEHIGGAAFLPNERIALSHLQGYQIRSTVTGEVLKAELLDVRSTGAMAAAADGSIVAVACENAPEGYSVLLVKP